LGRQGAPINIEVKGDNYELILETKKSANKSIVINFNGFRNFFGGYDTHSFGVLYKPNHFCINWVFTL